jgi:hypothetical protein
MGFGRLNSLGGGFGRMGGLHVVAPPVVNLLTNSETFVQWTATGATVTQNVDNDSRGVGVGCRLIEFANLSAHSLNSPNNINFVAGKTYTLSVEGKFETGQFLQLLFGSAAFGANAWGNFDMQAGQTATMGSAATGSVKSLGNGRYRFKLTAVATTTAAAPVAIFAANSGTMTRAASYTGVATNTRLIANAQVVEGTGADQYASTEAQVPLIGNISNTIVGAIRWDAWHHPTEDTIRTAVETSLGPPQYHWRLPFFATEPTASSALIAGAQADMDAEIDLAVRAGLNFWAFFWYGAASTNGMVTAWTYFQASARKNDINWCLYFSGITTLHSEVATNLANVVSYIQQRNYQTTADGRPLIFVFDDSGSRTTTAADISALRSALASAGVKNPYIAFHQSTPDATVITTYGFDATTTYAPVSSVTGAQPFSALDTAARSKWAAQAAQGVDVVPAFSMGWDRRPRVENPVPWETPSGTLSDYYYLVRSTDISTHVDACLSWVRANPTAAKANVVIGYAWNENDEGGWITPTRATLGVNRGHIDALWAVLKNQSPANIYRPNYVPVSAIGSDLIECWDARRADTILALSDATYTNAVHSWTGLVTGANLAQTTPLLKPVYDPVGLNGGPCIIFDGIQQYLTCTDAAFMALLPIGSTACEIWVLCSQDVAGADGTTRHVAGYANTSVVNVRSLARLPVTGVNRARIYTGTGAAATVATDTAVDLSGIHVMRGIFGSTQSSIEVDGNTAVSATVTPVTSAPLLFRVGAIPASAASNWWQGKVAAVFITKPLSAQKAADLHKYLG